MAEHDDPERDWERELEDMERRSEDLEEEIEEAEGEWKRTEADPWIPAADEEDEGVPPEADEGGS
jgi:hypothetical protein